jgi:hypothetical protein
VTDEPRTESALSWLPWAVAIVVCAVAGFIGATFLLTCIDRFEGPRRATECMSNQSQLAQGYQLAIQEKRFDPTLHGSAQILSWLPTLRKGEEIVVLCPGDEIPPPETGEETRPYHPVGADALRGARGLGSYAVRDFEKFPIDPNSTEKQAILCDRQGADGRTNHHKGCIVVAFATGDAQKLTRAELGLRDDEPIVVGPDSRSPLLRVFERP